MFTLENWSISFTGMQISFNYLFEIKFHKRILNKNISSFFSQNKNMQIKI